MSKVYKATRPQEKETKEKVLSIYEIFMMRVLKTFAYGLTNDCKDVRWQIIVQWNLKYSKWTHMLKVLVLMTEAYKHKQVFTYIHSQPICMKLVNTKVQLVSVFK